MTQPQLKTRSELAFERASKVMPGGVNSPVRSCKAVDATPIFIERADGSYMWDIDQNRYIDYVGSWGPMILGHRHPRVLEALEDALMMGTSYGAPSVHEIELAELIVSSVPSIEMVRLVSSGTEATMSAIRLARAYTKRDMIIKFDGCYHGHADSFLIKAGSGLQTLGISSSPGVPEELAKLTISLPFNDIDALKKAFKEYDKKIAAVILEPIIGNAGLILPDDGYLQAVRELTKNNGTVLIFDEVMTGFRVALGGVQERYKIKPDLTTLGKIIGGGLPVGAYGGKKEIMEMIAPLGTVYQAGTLSGNPIAMAAGIAQLRMLQIPHTYEQLDYRTKKLADGLNEIIKKQKLSAQVASVTGMICLFFCNEKVTDLESAQKCDTKKFAKFWQGLRDRGVYWPPSQFEAAFISLEHSKQDIDDTLKAVEESLAAI